MTGVWLDCLNQDFRDFGIFGMGDFGLMELRDCFLASLAGGRVSSAKVRFFALLRMTGGFG